MLAPHALSGNKIASFSIPCYLMREALVFAFTRMPGSVPSASASASGNSMGYGEMWCCWNVEVRWWVDGLLSGGGAEV